MSALDDVVRNDILETGLNDAAEELSALRARVAELERPIYGVAAMATWANGDYKIVAYAIRAAGSFEAQQVAEERARLLFPDAALIRATPSGQLR